MKKYASKMVITATVILGCIMLSGCNPNMDEKNEISNDEGNQINEEVKEPEETEKDINEEIQMDDSEDDAVEEPEEVVEMPSVNGVTIGIKEDDLLAKMEDEYEVIDEKNHKFIHYYSSEQDNNDIQASIADSGLDFFININTNTVSGFRIMSKEYDFSEGISVGDNEVDATNVLMEKYPEYHFEYFILNENFKLFEINDDYVIGIFIDERTSLVQIIYVVNKEHFSS